MIATRRVTRGMELRQEWVRLQEAWPALQGWTLKVNPRLTRTAGRCRWNALGEPVGIEIARWHLERSEWPEVVNTLRHEAAHALAPRNAHHGWAWKVWAVKVGARPERCYREAVAAHAPANQRPAKYALKCQRCGRAFPRRRRPPAGRRYYHRSCGGTLDLEVRR